MSNNLLKRYEGNKSVRTLIQLIPGGVGSAIDTYLELRIKELKEKRLQTFFDEINNQLSTNTLDLIDSDDFLHCYFITIRAVLNSRREKKINLFAKVFLGSIDNDVFKEIDEYEELISILDDLSYREIVILSILNTFEEQNPPTQEDSLISNTEKYWDKFKDQVADSFDISRKEVISIIMRLTKSGFLTPQIAEEIKNPDKKTIAGKEIVMSGATINLGEPKYRLNSFYYKFRQLINDNARE